MTPRAVKYKGASKNPFVAYFDKRDIRNVTLQCKRFANARIGNAGGFLTGPKGKKAIPVHNGMLGSQSQLKISQNRWLAGSCRAATLARFWNQYSSQAKNLEVQA